MAGLCQVSCRATDVYLNTFCNRCIQHCCERLTQSTHPNKAALALCAVSVRRSGGNSNIPHSTAEVQVIQSLLWQHGRQGEYFHRKQQFYIGTYSEISGLQGGIATSADHQNHHLCISMGCALQQGKVRASGSWDSPPSQASCKGQDKALQLLQSLSCASYSPCPHPVTCRDANRTGQVGERGCNTTEFSIKLYFSQKPNPNSNIHGFHPLRP